MELAAAYRVLEVPVGASADEVRDARVTLAKVWHPDRHAGDEVLRCKAERKLAAINVAFDAIRAAGFPPAAPPARPAMIALPPSSPEPPATEFVPRRRVRWQVVMVIGGIIGVGASLAITSRSTASAPAAAPLTRPPSSGLWDRPEPPGAPRPPEPRNPPPSTEAVGKPAAPETFTLGSTRDDVRAVMGPPRGIQTVITEDWSYGMSTVEFDPDTGRVVGWAERLDPLKVALAPHNAEAAEAARAAGGFTVGSSKDEVIAVQGTPTEIDRVINETWSYGFSTVEFDRRGRVTEWSEFDVPLRVRR